jgi:hypothetical protein
MVLTMSKVSEKAPAGLQTDDPTLVDKSAGHLDANAPAVEIKQRSREPHSITIDGEAGWHAQDIASTGHPLANVGATKACFESLRWNCANNRAKHCRCQNAMYRHASLLSRVKSLLEFQRWR